MDDVELVRAIARDVAARGGRAYYVGGFVRDRILGRESKDIDIEAHGIEVAELEQVLSRYGTVEERGVSFGTLNLHGRDLDVSVPRRADAQGRGGKGQVGAVADPWLGIREAARRRDLTMDALYEDVLTGEVIDPFGGREDIARGVVRHADPVTFVEDPLRVLRAAQLAARFDMRVADETVGLCSGLDLSGLASERVLGEVEKALLKASRPSTFFGELRRMGQLVPWLAEVGDLAGVPQNPTWHPEGDVWEHTMLVVDAAAGLRGKAEQPLGLMLSALCHDLGKAVTTELHDGRIVSYGHERAGVPLARDLLRRLGPGKRVQRYVLTMVELHMAPNAYVAQGAKQKAYNRLFDRSVSPHDLLLLAQADSLGRGGAMGTPGPVDELRDRLAAYEELMARPYVDGSDLIAAGMQPGPKLGEALRYAHKLRLAGLSKDEQLRQALGRGHGDGGLFTRA